MKTARHLRVETDVAGRQVTSRTTFKLLTMTENTRNRLTIFYIPLFCTVIFRFQNVASNLWIYNMIFWSNRNFWCWNWWQDTTSKHPPIITLNFTHYNLRQQPALN